MKSLVPNSLTLANLSCGILSIMAIFGGDFIQAAWLVGFSLIFDFLDGFAARLLKVHSELGKQLDSLADMVTFGVVPGLLMYKLFHISLQNGIATTEYLSYIALLIPLFSALRLAKFNIDTRQSDYFIGLPTPANTIFIFAFVLLAIYSDNNSVKEVLLHPIFLTAITIVCSLLLVAELPLMSLKIKSLSWKENRPRLILILGIVILIVFLGLRALVFIIPLYLLLSLIFKPHQK